MRINIRSHETGLMQWAHPAEPVVPQYHALSEPTYKHVAEIE